MSRRFAQKEAFRTVPQRSPQEQFAIYWQGRDHTLGEWVTKLNRCNWKCYWCAKRLSRDTATQDHLTPVSRLGTDTIDNIVPACRQCNSMKGTMNEEEFVEWKAARCGKKGTGILLKNPEDESELLAALERERDPKHFSAGVKLRREGLEASWAWRNHA